MKIRNIFPCEPKPRRRFIKSIFLSLFLSFFLNPANCMQNNSDWVSGNAKKVASFFKKVFGAVKDIHMQGIGLNEIEQEDEEDTEIQKDNQIITFGSNSVIPDELILNIIGNVVDLNKPITTENLTEIRNHLKDHPHRCNKCEDCMMIYNLLSGKPEAWLKPHSNSRWCRFIPFKMLFWPFKKILHLLSRKQSSDPCDFDFFDNNFNVNPHPIGNPNNNFNVNTHSNEEITIDHMNKLVNGCLEKLKSENWKNIKLTELSFDEFIDFHNFMTSVVAKDSEVYKEFCSKFPWFIRIFSGSLRDYFAQMYIFLSRNFNGASKLLFLGILNLFFIEFCNLKAEIDFANGRCPFIDINNISSCPYYLDAIAGLWQIFSLVALGSAGVIVVPIAVFFRQLRDTHIRDKHKEDYNLGILLERIVFYVGCFSFPYLFYFLIHHVGFRGMRGMLYLFGGQEFEKSFLDKFLKVLGEGLVKHSLKKLFF